MMVSLLIILLLQLLLFLLLPLLLLLLLSSFCCCCYCCCCCCRYEGERLLRTTRFLVIERDGGPLGGPPGGLQLPSTGEQQMEAARAAKEAERDSSSSSSSRVEVYRQLERMYRVAYINDMLGKDEALSLLPGVSSSLLRSRLQRRHEGPNYVNPKP